MVQKSKSIKEAKKETMHIMKSQTSLYNGPLPPPESLEKYEKILPGTADRILSNFER